MGEVFLTLYGSVSQETPNDDPQHGGTPSYGALPPPEGSPTPRLAGVQYTTPDGACSLGRQEVEGRGPMAIHSVPSKQLAAGGLS